MDGLSAAAILKAVSEYGVLGLGWIAWILTMAYLRAERKRYETLVVHIVQYFTKVNLIERKTDEPLDLLGAGLSADSSSTYERLVGRQAGRDHNATVAGLEAGRKTTRRRRGQPEDGYDAE